MPEFPKTRAQLVSSLLWVLAAAFLAFVMLVELVRYTALFFCSILAAVALSAVAERLRFRGRLSHPLALAVTLAVLVVLSGGLAWWIGPQLVPQFEELTSQVPRGLREARSWFEASPIGQQLSADLPDLSDAVPSPKTMLQSIGQLVGAGFSALADFLIPALAVAVLKSPMHAVYVAALYLGVQLVESYLVEPMVEARAISLPPALIIGAQVISAVWLGPIGVLIATPLLVVVVVAVQILYQRELLGDSIEVIGG